jgi:hypothetical protein
MARPHGALVQIKVYDLQQAYDLRLPIDRGE